ncbi:MAG: hypothetical protein M1832_005095 [Thelocarpon impressellum]|nr:MAG: hypothetical protein M1832_005095 [Thelocarpon impressellum]
MADAIANPPVRNESKSAKKKKAKQEVGKSSSVASATPSGDAAGKNGVAHEGVNGIEGKDYESPYIQELYKSIRNINKKINATAKVDSILAEHPKKTLDELVAERKINNDQKAQALKKPSLQASLSQLQEQVAQYKKIDQDYQARVAAEKTALRQSHEAELAKAKEEAGKAAAERAKNEAEEEERGHTLLLSKFLRLAAAKRQEGEAETDDAKALEGLLLMVYGGDASAVSAAEKLMQGADEPVLSTEHQPLDYSYAQVKKAALAYEPYQPSGEESLGEGGSAEPTDPAGAGTDPTVAHAGLNEDTTAILPTNGVSGNDETQAVVEQSTIDVGAANEVAATHWDADAKLSASAEGDWVEVGIPRDPAETETGVTATPAAMSGTQSWADEQPPAAPPTAITPDTNTSGSGPANDGFHEVHHHRGGRGRGGPGGPQGERRGSFRGGRGGYRGGEGGGFRGRGGGFRGDRGGNGEGGYRGRGRGGFRGGRGREGGDNSQSRRPDEA